MRLLAGSAVGARIVGVLAGSFHPVTRAHLALAEAALRHVDRVIFAMPGRFPHKEYEQVSLQDRLGLVCAAVAYQPAFSVAETEGGLFLEMARECRELLGTEVELWFLCGRDAAERVISWDYGRDVTAAELLRDAGLLVAERHGAFRPPTGWQECVRPLMIDGDWSDVSASEVRRRIRAGEPWDHLVPASIVGLVGEVYGRLADQG
jgi:nicotinate-nucleotide adenylyltransferase